jgi:hypothetical protein
MPSPCLSVEHECLWEVHKIRECNAFGVHPSSVWIPSSSFSTNFLGLYYLAEFSGRIDFMLYTCISFKELFVNCIGFKSHRIVCFCYRGVLWYQKLVLFLSSDIF